MFLFLNRCCRVVRLIAGAALIWPRIVSKVLTGRLILGLMG